MCSNQAIPGTSNHQDQGLPAAAEPMTGIPIKRILDDDVQFVSEKPVKKRRISDGPLKATEHSTQPGSEATQQATIHANKNGGPHDASQNSGEVSGKATPQPASEPPPEPPSARHLERAEMEPRGASLPAMEKFSFSQKLSTNPQPAVRKSPQLSPKQLPQTISPGLLTPLPREPLLDSFSFTDFLEQPLYPGFENTFDFMSALPPPVPMTSETGFSQRVLDPPMWAPAATQMAEYGVSNPPANLMTLAQAAVCTAPMEQPSSHPAQSTANVAPDGSTKEAEPAEKKPETPKEEDTNMGTRPPNIQKQTGQPSTQAISPKTQRSQTSPPSQLSQLQHPLARQAPVRRPCPECAAKWRQQQAYMNNIHGVPALRFVPTAHPCHLFGPAPQPGQVLPGPRPPAASQVSARQLPGYSKHSSPLHINTLIGPTVPSPQPPLPPPPVVAPTKVPGNSAQLAQSSQGKPAPPSRNQTPGPHGDPKLQDPSTPGRRQQSPPVAAPSPAPAGAVATAAAPGSGKKQPATAAGATKRTPAPNLYVDIAETCLEMFPYAEVARRHTVSRQRVADVFAAVVQLPLLRCPTDKRRVGKLGVTRMKEYNKARKDLQAEKAAAAAASGGVNTASTTSSSTAPANNTTATANKKSGQTGQGKEAPPAAPSIYEVAQYMGPLNIPEVAKHGFTAPW